MMAYHHLLWPLLAGTGYAALTKEYPLFGYWMMVVSMAIPDDCLNALLPQIHIALLWRNDDSHVCAAGRTDCTSAMLPDPNSNSIRRWGSHDVPGVTGCLYGDSPRRTFS